MTCKRYLTISLMILFPFIAGAQSMHPQIKLLDANKKPVIQSGNPVSTMQTCGACHDTEYISTHSYHSQAGMGERYTDTDNAPRPWEKGPGYYNRWEPLYYEFLNQDNSRVNFGTANWVMTYGARHIGGGPAEYNEQGQPLPQRDATLSPVESLWSNPETGAVGPWDWQKSGSVEMDCFLCHIPNPDNEARKNALKSGNFKWANTAGLQATGIVSIHNNSYQYNSQYLTADGYVEKSALDISDPSNQNCGLCHGIVQETNEAPLTLDDCTPEHWTTITTGQIFSPQRIAESGMNIKNKSDLSRSWDVHAERLVDCVDCHFSINNPIYYRESAETRPEHLNFDARRLDIDDYLHRPSHQFARGPRANPTGKVQPNTMRRCESCHSIEKTHDWLPYKERHMSTMTCESCHIPYLHATTRQSIDWTLPNPDNTPRFECRGIKDGTPNANTMMQGFKPILLSRKEADGTSRLAPFNIISTWYWATGDGQKPVDMAVLQKLLYKDGEFTPQIISILDSDQNGRIEKAEQVLDNQDKITAFKSLLADKGYKDAVIKAEAVPHAIHHNVTHGEWTTRTCETCHSKESILSKPIMLAGTAPPVKPEFINTDLAKPVGPISQKGGAWLYTPSTLSAGYFILGFNKSMLVQIIGASLFVIVLVGITVHGSLRVITAARHKNQPGPYHNVYIYALYERFWHWMQAIAIVGLIFTGLNIHAPMFFRFMPFNIAVVVHNVLGFLLLINAFLAAFYHYSSGKIKHYLPEPKGFFSQTIEQGMYYLKGIFKNEPHPFEKNAEKKLNPLQKLTYLVILNILLPAQIVTGILIWGAQRWPNVSKAIGGLYFLVPAHSLMAWLFAAFLILHMYLTTTGYTATSSVKAMVTGWEKIENHQ